MFIRLLNIASLLGWAGVLAVTAQRFAAGDNSTVNLWDPTDLLARATLALELVSVFELLRMVTGSLHGNWALGLPLHYTRLFMLLVVLPAVSGGSNVGLVILLAWSATEVGRYPVYIHKSALTTTLRNSVPVVTFPLGAGWEALACQAYAVAAAPGALLGQAATAQVFINVVLGGLIAYPGVMRRGLKGTPLGQLYLVLYNAGAMAGWGTCLYLGATALARSGGDLTAVYPAMAHLLPAVQLSAGLEILHSLSGVVRSPLTTTFLQVMSRVIVIVVVLAAPGSQTTWSCGMMCLSWSLVEVPRYGFYVYNLFAPADAAARKTFVPYPLFFLRYSLFAVLYPTGITGEVLTLYAALSAFPHQLAAFSLGGAAVGAALPAFIKFVFVTYVPGSPIMYLHMVKTRAKQMKGRFAKPPPPPKGTLFPEDGKGGRSTTPTGKAVVAAALAGAGDAEGSAKCLKEKVWRFRYHKHLMRLVRSSLQDPAAALGGAKAGIARFYESFEFADPADPSKVVSFAENLETNKGSFATGVVRGEAAPRSDLDYVVPYNGGWHPSSTTPPTAEKNGLVGEGLKAQLNAWVAGGIVEADAAKGVAWTADYFAAGRNLSDTYFVMIGAGSAMGPFPKLLELGANVVAIDIPGSWGKGSKRPVSGLWERLIGAAKRSPGGSITFPLSKPQPKCTSDLDMYESAGCNLMEQPAEVANWLEAWQSTIPAAAKVVIGNYTYLDGANHVKLALCADACIDRLCKVRKSTAVAFLCTPTDIHVIPEEAAAAAKAAYGSGLGSFGLEKLLNLLSLGKFLQSNVVRPVKAKGGKTIHLVDGLSVAQGPNYGLAKRLQHWRAQVAYSEGHTVSTMVAPSTATLSVIHNKTFAWAYGGMPYFKFEIFKQETTNAVMASLLINDVLNDGSPKNPKNKAAAGVDNSLELFKTQGVHGGLWRAAYTVDTIGEVCALIYFACGGQQLF